MHVCRDIGNTLLSIKAAAGRGWHRGGGDTGTESYGMDGLKMNGAEDGPGAAGAQQGDASVHSAFRGCKNSSRFRFREDSGGFAAG